MSNLVSFVLECECNTWGTKENICNKEGNCDCRKNVEGERCDKCHSDFYSYPSCGNRKYNS